MRNPSSLKQEFLEKWIKGLQSYSALKKEMNIFERKKAIKTAADIAMASTRNAKTCWSRTLMANAASSDDNTKILVEHVSGSQFKWLKKSSIRSTICNKSVRSKQVVKKSCRARRVRKVAADHVVHATSVARKLMKRRTQVLKSLVPGGEYMDENSLIMETLDYIASLRVQVDVMRSLANASDHLHCKLGDQ